MIRGLGTNIDQQRRGHERVDDDAQNSRIDSARKAIFRHGAGIKSTRVEDILKPRSEVPTRISKTIF